MQLVGRIQPLPQPPKHPRTLHLQRILRHEQACISYLVGRRGTWARDFATWKFGQRRLVVCVSARPSLGAPTKYDKLQNNCAHSQNVVAVKAAAASAAAATVSASPPCNINELFYIVCHFHGIR